VGDGVAAVTRPVLLDNTILTNFALVDLIPRTGSIGILVSCVRRGLLSRDEAEYLLEEMIASDYRSPVDSLGSLIDQQEERSR